MSDAPSGICVGGKPLVGTKNRKVAAVVGVGNGVLVGRVGVAVGGEFRAVWVAAAPAVRTIAVNGAFGSKVGIGVDAGPKTGKQARIKTVATKIKIVL